MTIDEKRKRLHDYCESCVGCFECLLNGKKHNWEKPCSEIPCPSIDESPEEDLDRALALVYEAKAKEFLEKKIDLANDPVNHPSHYTQGGIECIDAIKASMTDLEFRGFLKGQVIKYMWRYALKGKPVEDLNKAEFYRKRLVEEIEKVN